MSGKPEFRKGQGVVPFGVGAIVDFPDDSLMAAGLDVWPQVSQNYTPNRKAKLLSATQITDGRLQKRLSSEVGRKIKYFLSLPEAPDNFKFGLTEGDEAKAFTPFVRFPTWHFCPRCRTMHFVPWNTPVGDSKLRCDSSVRLHEGGKAKNCAELAPKKRPYLIPVRFAVACKAGHITDFPWQEWAHRDRENCGAGTGKLFLVSTGGTGLGGLKVVCSECKASSTMAGAFNKGAFTKIWQNGCPGERPWLGPHATQPDCREEPVTIQCGASNAYFAHTVNSILIPPYSQLLRRTLDEPDLWEQIESLPLYDGKLPQQLLEVMAKQKGIESSIFIQAVYEKLGQSEDEAIEETTSEQDYRAAEFNAFLGVRPPHEERLDFDILHQDIELYHDKFKQFFKHAVMIPRLRETRALLGFSRVEPAASKDNIASLSLNPQEWFPATEVRGEGIFLVLHQTKIAEWIKLHSEVEERTAIVNSHLIQSSKSETPRQITTEFLLLHSLAHALIRQMVFDCGYDSSALRERIYVGDTEHGEMAGILIYTASGDSEGTLGGLVRQGLPDRLEKTFLAAIANSRLCSSDPLCSESEGQGVAGLNLAACHACLLLPETSCEEGNRLLDRALLIGTASKPELGFFYKLYKD